MNKTNKCFSIHFFQKAIVSLVTSLSTFRIPRGHTKENDRDTLRRQGHLRESFSLICISFLGDRPCSAPHHTFAHTHMQYHLWCSLGAVVTSSRIDDVWPYTGWWPDSGFLRFIDFFFSLNSLDRLRKRVLSSARPQMYIMWRKRKCSLRNE